MAEEVVYGTFTTGAESDIQQLTLIARQMVGRWGMSDAVGPVAVLPQDGAGPLLPGVSETSEHTHRLVDEEVRRMIEAAHHEVTELLDRAPRAARAAWPARCSRRRRSTRPTPTPPRQCRCRVRRLRRHPPDATCRARDRPRRPGAPLPPAAARLPSSSTPAVQTARLASAETTIAVATTDGITCRERPSAATAAGTPSWAVAASAAGTDLRGRHRSQQVNRGR